MAVVALVLPLAVLACVPWRLALEVEHVLHPRPVRVVVAWLPRRASVRLPVSLVQGVRGGGFAKALWTRRRERLFGVALVPILSGVLLLAVFSLAPPVRVPVSVHRTAGGVKAVPFWEAD